MAVAASAIRLRRLVAEDLEAAHGLSRAVQWPHRLEDWRFVHRLGVGFAAEAASRLVGTAMCWTYGPQFAAVGMVIVAPDCQGRGIGRRLMAKVLAEAGTRTVILNGTDTGAHLYESFGFSVIGCVNQHQGLSPSARVAPLPTRERLRPVEPTDKPVLVELDTLAGGMPRTEVIAALLSTGEGIVLDRNGEDVGFALLRRFGHGCVMGPVVAPDVDGAKALISRWVDSHRGTFMRIDVPADCGLSDWLRDLGLAPAGLVATMSKGTPPIRGERARLYALVSQALG